MRQVLGLSGGAVNQHQMARLLELARGFRQQFDGLLAACDARALRLHACRTIQENQNGVRGGRERPSKPAASQRSRHERNQHQYANYSKKQDQELTQTGMTGGVACRRNQEAHGRPRLRSMPQAVKKMDDDRQKYQRQRPE